MIRTSITLIAVAVAVFLFQSIDALQARHDRALQDLQAERDSRARAEAASEVHRAHIKRMGEDARAAQTLINHLQTMEGRDAPLSPLLRATADGLFGTGR